VRERKEIAEMLGEFWRDAAVLVYIFVPLDLFIGSQLSLSAWDVTLIVLGTAIGSSLMEVVGIILERNL
jgi:positive regulator of sigma E activity